MGNFEKLSVLVIVVIIVMILVVALYTWTDNPDQTSGGTNTVAAATDAPKQPPVVEGGMTTGSGVSIAPPLKKDGPVGDPKEAKAGSLEELLSKAAKEAQGPKNNDPLPPVPPPAPAPAAPRTYTVKAGDTLSGIAKAEYPKTPKQGLQAILQANPKAGEMLRVKDVLVIPELTVDGLAVDVKPASGTAAPPVTPRDATSSITKGGVYVVKKGDTLVSISKGAYRTADKWQDIWLTNFDVIEDVDHLTQGTRLKIPR